MNEAVIPHVFCGIVFFVISFAAALIVQIRYWRHKWRWTLRRSAVESPLEFPLFVFGHAVFLPIILAMAAMIVTHFLGIDALGDTIAVAVLTGGMFGGMFGTILEAIPEG